MTKLADFTQSAEGVTEYYSNQPPVTRTTEHDNLHFE